MRCGRCGNDNAEANRFCGMCGAALLHKTETPVKPPAKTSPPEVPRPALTSVLAGGERTSARQSSEISAPAAPPPPSSPRATEVFSPRDPEPRPEPLITGPSFLGLNTPGPATDRYTPSHSSGNLDYLLDEEEEPKRGWGKLLLIVAALALALGFGYLRWKQGGFDWLNASNKKPAAMAPETTPNSDSQSSSAQDRPAPIPTDAAPSTPANGNSAAPPQSAQPQTSPPQNPAAQSSSAPNSHSAPDSHAPAAPAANPAPQNTPQQTEPAQSKPGDSGPPPDAESQLDSDSEAAPAVETPAPKATTRKSAPAKPSAATSYASVAEAERYIYGRGVRQDCDHGLQLLKPAAERADAQAMISLAALYTTGTCTPRDLPTAYRWFALALHKQPDNQSLQDDLKSLWARMTPPERQLAIKLSQSN